MADIFISYKSEDRTQASELDRHLRARGYTTWWDTSLLAGKNWNDEIREQLAAAHCILVVWSKRSWLSKWVQAEARIGFSSSKLVACRLDDVTIGFPFDGIQTPDLRTAEGFDNLMLGVQAMLGSAPADSDAAAELKVSCRILDDPRLALSRTLIGHQARITCLGFSPGGKHLITGSDDRTARIWDVASGGESRTLQGHRGKIVAVAYLPSGDLVMTASYHNRIFSSDQDNSVRIWNPVEGRQVESIVKVDDLLHHAALSPDGNLVAVAYGYNCCAVWDRSGRQKATLVGHSWGVRHVCFSPDGTELATASEDQSIKIWHAQTGKLRASLVGHNDVIDWVSYSANGDIASGCRDKSVRIWDGATLKLREELLGHESWVASVQFVPDSNAVLSGSLKEVRIWDSESGEIVLRNPLHDRLWDARLSPNGHTLGLAFDDGCSQIWEIV